MGQKKNYAEVRDTNTVPLAASEDGTVIVVNTLTAEEDPNITDDDVWGKRDEGAFARPGKGMVVAVSGMICPIFDDIVSPRHASWKAVTVVCKRSEYEGVRFVLECHHGANCIDKAKVLPGDRVALRSEYQGS